MTSVNRATASVVSTPPDTTASTNAPAASSFAVRDGFSSQSSSPLSWSNFAATDPSAVNPLGINVDQAAKMPWISQLTPNGADATYQNGDVNCGPTSLAMVARYFGLGGNQTDAQLITQLAQIGQTDPQSGTSPLGILHMAHALGLKCAARGPVLNDHWSCKWIDAYLASGNPVVACGNGAREPGHHGNFGHYIVIAGKTPDGQYIVRDPMDPNEQHLTPRQLSAYINSNPQKDGNVFAIGNWTTPPA